MSHITVNQLYYGSTILQPVSVVLGLPVDQVNFLACQLFGLFLGFPYRLILGPHRASAQTRHVVQILVGITMAYFCFGSQVIHMFIQSFLCLAIMRVLKPGIMEKAVLAVAMLYLCVCHLNRMYYDYGGYTLDITGPLMLNTQRLSSLAFNLRDGNESDESKLTPMMRRLGIKSMPSLLEAASYIFCFHGLMCGPFCFYKDYIVFIEGEKENCNSLAKGDNQENQVLGTNHINHRKDPPPGPGICLAQKLMTTAIFGISTILVIPMFPPSLVTALLAFLVPIRISRVFQKMPLSQSALSCACYFLNLLCILSKLLHFYAGKEFENHGFIYKNFLVVFLTSLQRQKYYFAWKLGESVNASCGLGFNGYDDKGRARWNLVDNADIWKIEFSTSLKQLLDNWNMSTIAWLRYVIYERYPSTMAVFVFSSCWHGFYAGYYMTFVSAGFFLNTARMVRRRIRPYFQSNKHSATAYDFVTFLVTKVSGSYVGFPFMILEFWPCVYIYWNVYLWMHVIALLLFISMLWLPGHKKASL